jgi:hypothetical protein
MYCSLKTEADYRARVIGDGIGRDSEEQCEFLPASPGSRHKPHRQRAARVWRFLRLHRPLKFALLADRGRAAPIASISR